MRMRLRVGEADDVTGVVLDAAGLVDMTGSFRILCLKQGER